MKAALAILLFLVSAPARAEGTAPEDIPVYRLGQTLPEAQTIADAEHAVTMTVNMMVVPTIRRAPAPGTWEPFCHGDCVEIQTTASFEPKAFGADLLTCEAVRAGLAVATAAWADLQASTDRLKAMTEELRVATGTDRYAQVLADLNALIRHINEQTRTIRAAYPPSFKEIDRKVVFQWTPTPARQFAGWPRTWVAQGLGIDLKEASVRGYVWKEGQGQVTDLGGIESLPSPVGRGLRFAMDSTPVQICSEGREVQLAGYVTIDVGIYDEQFTAWKTNAQATLKAILKGTPP